jgi:hypothetical protein
MGKCSIFSIGVALFRKVEIFIKIQLNCSVQKIDQNKMIIRQYEKILIFV